MQIFINMSNMVATLLGMMKVKSFENENLKDAESCVATLTAALKEHEKNHDQDECSKTDWSTRGNRPS